MLNKKLMEFIFIKLGFACSWVKLIMNYVTSISYSHIINGVNLDSFRPTKGLRHERGVVDLFVVVVEGLSRLIQRVKRMNLIKVVRVVRSCARIFHLFFTDDNFIFLELNELGCSNLKLILKQYEAVLDQRINLAKLVMSFCPNTDKSLKLLTQNVLYFYF